MKRLFKNLVIPFVLGVAFIYATPKIASASTWDNAKTYYDTYGTAKKVYNKKVYWCTKSGSAVTSNRYSIEAWRISGQVGYYRDLPQKTQGYSVPSGTAGSRSNADQSLNNFIFHPSTVNSGGYRYDLYYIDLLKMREVNSSMASLFDSALKSKSEVTLRLDGLSFYSVSSGQWWSGESDRYGNVGSLASTSQGYKDNRYGSTLGEAKGMNAGMFSGITFDGWYNQIIHVPVSEVPQKITPTKPSVDFVSIDTNNDWSITKDGAAWVRPTDSKIAPGWLSFYSRGYQDFPYPGYDRENNRVNSHYLRLITPDGHDEKFHMTKNNNLYRYANQDQIDMNNVSPQFTRWISGTYEHSSAYTYLKFKYDNKDYNVDLYVDSENGQLDGYYTKNKVKTDGRAPTVDTTPTIEDGKLGSATITFHNAGDVRGDGENIRAGVGMSTQEDIDQSLKIYKPGEEDKAVYVYVSKRTETGIDKYGVPRHDLQWVINYDDAKFNSLGLKDYYGELKFKIHLEDWLSNTYESGEYSLKRANPTPDLAEVELKSWHYSEPNSNIKWVNAKESFEIQTSLKSSEEFSQLEEGYPTGTNLLIEDDSTNLVYKDEATVVSNSIINNLYFSLNLNDSKAIKYIDNSSGVSKKAISSKRNLIAKPESDGKILDISTTGYTTLNGIKYPLNKIEGEVNGNKIGIDATAPVISGFPSDTWTNKDVKVTLNAIDRLSGIKSIELYEGTNKLSSGVSNLSYNVTTEGIHTFKVVAKDNVGNIKEQSFTVKIDKTAPVITGQTLYGWSKDNIKISSAATDKLSGMENIELFDRTNTKVASSINDLSYNVTSSGISQFKVVAKDKVGNTSSVIVTARIDRLAPSSVPEFNYNEEAFDLTITSDYVIENESGIKEIWAEYSPSNNTNLVKKQNLTLKKSYNSTNSNLEDLNGDGVVDTRDITIITKLSNISFGNSSYIAKYDFDFDGTISNKDIQKVKDAVGNRYTYTAENNLYDLLGECGKAKVVIKAKDNCNNERVLAEKEFNVSITPVDPFVDIKKVKYQDGNTYWVNTKEEFQIFTKVNTNNYPLHPRDTRLYIGGNGINSDKYSGTKIIADTSSINFTEGTEGTRLFDKYNNYNAIKSTSSDKTKKYLEATHSLIARDAANNMRFNLYSNGSIPFRDKVFYSSMASTNKILAVDSVAPTLVSDSIINKTENTFTINMNGVTDGSGSGIKSVDVKVWVEENSIKKYEKTYNVKADSKGEYNLIIDRTNFGNIRRNYKYQISLTDNVDNVRVYPVKDGQMLQYNLTANRIDIFDPRENRYVTQVISGLEYYAVVEVQNTGELDVNIPFEVALKRDNKFTGKIEVNNIKINEKKDYKIPFIAEEENLKGVVYEGIVDYTNVIDEYNESDNKVSTEKPYDIPRDDNNPPIIPTPIPDGSKIPDPPPIITVELDLKASFVDVVEVNSDKIISELIPGDRVRIKYIIENMGSFSLKNYDILNKSFNNEVIYDGTKIDEVTISEIDKDERKTFYKDYVIPELKPDEIEVIKKLTLKVDSNNVIYESNENNNIISTNKKVLGLKVTNYRITNIVNPPTKYVYPIDIKNMPVSVKAGYNVTLRADVQGNPDRVYVRVTDNKGSNYGEYEMKKVKEISSNKAEYEFTFTTPLDSENGTIFISEIIATRNTSTYNYNRRENWNGYTLKIGGNALDDIIIFRRH